METFIYLIRHGETNWNRERRFQGQMDIPLNEYGKQQAKKLVQRLQSSKININAVYSSDLIRAKETAEYIAAKFNFEVRVETGLKERNFGLLEGINIDEIKSKYPDVNLANVDKYHYLKVEPFFSFKKRIYNTILQLSRQHVNEQIVIISHGAAINSFLDEISNGYFGPGKIKIANTSITTIAHDHRSDLWNIKGVNDSSHIEAM